jgi:phosphatidylserine decarboxylase
MGIHKEGLTIITIAFVLLFFTCLVIYYLFHNRTASVIGVIGSVLCFLFVLRFFRVPNRPVIPDENVIYAPADGTVVVIEQTNENEYFKDKRIQVSIFMSVWNVHINWFPVSGTVKYFRHHPGKYLVARLPKSSTDNERTTTVLQAKDSTQILVRQIAGFIARRIVPYAKEGMAAKQGDELGFIKFGSRVDLFLPLGTKINVKMGEKVTGKRTVICRLK